MGAELTIKESFDSLDTSDDIGGVTVKGRRVEDSSLNLLSGVYLGWDEEFLYVHYKKDIGGFSLNPPTNSLKIPLEEVRWSEIYLAEEDKKDKQNFMTAAAYFGTGNAMQSYDYSRLYVRIPFNNPETSEEEFIEFKLKNEKRMKRIQRFLGKNKARMENKEQGENDKSAVEILKERFAKGEIDKGEYEDRLAVLENSEEASSIQKCSNCGEEVEEEQDYCSNCGSSV